MLSVVDRVNSNTASGRCSVQILSYERDPRCKLTLKIFLEQLRL